MKGERVVVLGPDSDASRVTAEELEFLKAMDAYRRKRPFPTWREVLAVVRAMGYRRVEEPGPLPIAIVDGRRPHREIEGPPAAAKSAGAGPA